MHNNQDPVAIRSNAHRRLIAEADLTFGLDSTELGLIRRKVSFMDAPDALWKTGQGCGHVTTEALRSSH